jgi:hypothetical protein
MLWMRSTRTMGSFRVDIPEEALTTLELDFYELQQLMGVSLATEYVRCHDSIVRQDYWVPQFRDPLYGIVHGGWHSSRAWRVQYWFGQFFQAHTIASPTPTPVSQGQPMATPTSMTTPAPVPNTEPTPTPTPTPTCQYQ